MLGYVLHELNIYGNYLTLDGEEFTYKYGSRSVITRTGTDRKWVIQNPADPEDNLADKWNLNPEIPMYFFRWIAACENDLIQSLLLPDNRFRTAMENAFGETTIQQNWDDKYKAITVTPKPIISTPKPYRR